jgi:hypothetical protein
MIAFTPTFDQKWASGAARQGGQANLVSVVHLPFPRAPLAHFWSKVGVKAIIGGWKTSVKRG